MQSNLKQSLITAISGLEKDIISYNWYEHNKCNCGVVVQALFGINQTDVDKLFNKALEEANIENDSITWRNICKQSCLITGEPMTDVFKRLYNAGLTPEDIVHLEYMNNPAILKESKIKHKFSIFKNRRTFFTNKNNLILYLKAWVRILDKKANTANFTKKEHLNADLLIAKSFGETERVRELEQQLTTL